MSRGFKLSVLVIVACMLAGVTAVEAAPGELATPNAGATGIEWRPMAAEIGLVLTVSGPQGFYLRQEFAPGQAAAFSLFDEAGGLRPAGSYVYELRAVPQIDDATRAELDAARESGADSSLAKAANAPAAQVQSGAFSIVDGALVAGGDAEPGARDLPVREGPVLAKKDIVHADDVIINGGSASLCVGFDCVNGENFGFDTIRTKENNTRIQFDDTSTTSGFATNNWQIRANSSASGGQSFLAFVDQGATGTSESGTILFQVTAGAPANSVVVDSTGRVGFRTATPVLDLHVSTTNTPAMRLEQTSAGGFTAQTWDVAGNEANFFVRSVTTGSQLPFRIRPGAPTSSIDIAADGDVGIGVASPEAKLHVENGSVLVQNTTNPGFSLQDDDGTGASLWNFELNANGLFQISKDGTGGAEVLVRDRQDPGGLETMDVDGSIEAVAFNVASSRTFKTAFEPVNAKEVLTRVVELPVAEWSFKWDAEGTRHIGPMAEDFLALFGVGNDATNISIGDAAGVALVAIQGLHEQVRERDDQVEELKSEVEKLRALVEKLTENR